MPDTPEILIDAFVTNTTAGASNPKVVTLSDGRLLAAYATEEGGRPGFDIRGQLFDASGVPIGEEVRFEHALEVNERAFDMVAVDGNRVAIVVEVRDPTGANRQTENTLFEVSDDGVRVANVGYTTSTGSGTQILNPTIADVGGEDDFRQFHIRRDAPDEALRMNGLEDGNVLLDVLDRDFRGNANAELDSTTLENGNIVVVLDRDGPEGRDELRPLVMTVTPFGNIVRQSNIGNRDVQAIDPVVTALVGGGYVVAYAEDGLLTKLVYQVFDQNGVGVGPLRSVGLEQGISFSNGTFSLDDNNEPAIAPLEDGGFIIFYDRDGGASQIRGQRFDDRGNRVGEDFLVADENGEQLDATLLPDGRVAVSYFVPGQGLVKGAVKTAILEIAEDQITITGTADRDELVGTNADDIILGLGGPDTINGLGGADTIDGGNGNDQIDGGGGNDTIEGGRGNDSIDGGGGSDSLSGGAGQDSLNGSFGADTLDGGAGNDTLTGGGANDTFLFAGNFGDDTVTDFAARNNNEKIDLSGVAGVDSFADLSGVVSQQGNDVLIDLAGGTITLENVALQDLDANDFLF